MSRLRMVVGLCFDLQRNVVAMVHKSKGPACVIGKWNGVGGKIEVGEGPTQAMRREFREETGVDIPEEEWHRFGTFMAADYDLFFFESRTPQVFECKTMEEETIKVWRCPELLRQDDVMNNIRWMVPYLQDSGVPADLGMFRLGS